MLLRDARWSGRLPVGLVFGLIGDQEGLFACHLPRQRTLARAKTGGLRGLLSVCCTQRCLLICNVCLGFGLYHSRALQGSLSLKGGIEQVPSVSCQLEVGDRSLITSSTGYENVTRKVSLVGLSIRHHRYQCFMCNMLLIIDEAPSQASKERDLYPIQCFCISPSSISQVRNQHHVNHKQHPADD